jgi:hypothetical protein
MGQPSTQVSFPAPVILLGRKFGFKRSSNEALADLKPSLCWWIGADCVYRLRVPLSILLMEHSCAFSMRLNIPGCWTDTECRVFGCYVAWRLRHQTKVRNAIAAPSHYLKELLTDIRANTCPATGLRLVRKPLHNIS